MSNPAYFRLGDLPIVICVIEKDGYYACGISATSTERFDTKVSNAIAFNKARVGLMRRFPELVEPVQTALAKSA